MILHFSPDDTYCTRLKLLPESEIKNSDDNLFLMEHVYSKDETEETRTTQEKNRKVSKSDMVRIKSKTLAGYLAIEQGKDGKYEIIISKNIASHNIFKFDFITQEEKIVVNFFVQLNCVLDYYLKFYNDLDKKSLETFSALPQQIEENYLKNLKEILKTSEESINFYKIEKVLIANEETLKIDMIRNLKEFMVIEKLLKILNLFWFKQETFEECLSNPNESKDKFIEFKKEFDKLKKENSTILKLKKECTVKIINILTIIYDIDQSFIYSVQNYLNYLFMFVGKIDQITQFLIHILRNNHILLMTLLSKFWFN